MIEKKATDNKRQWRNLLDSSSYHALDAPGYPR